MSGPLVLVLNAGSSSLKCGLFEAAPDGGPRLLAGGQVEGLGGAARLALADAGGRALAARSRPAGAAVDHREALAALFALLPGLLGGRPVAIIGHRVVHGGVRFAAPVAVDEAVLAELEALVPLAPLHQPHNLAGIRAARALFPGIPQLACFDTAFHRTQPEEAERFALPERFFALGIRRYGFHGLSYAWIARRLQAEDPALAAGRVVVAHLGNGASLCALQGGVSQGSSMGFTALDGVPMGTRCGQLDPGVVLYMLDQLGMSSAEVARVLYHESGLKGLSGISHDVREIEAAGGPAAERALGHFAYRVRREIGALAAALGGLDGLVFTGGIGEHAAGVRARICAGLEFLGVRLDPAANAAHAPEIGAPDAPVRVLLRRAGEEEMIALHALEWLAGKGDGAILPGGRSAAP
ncbi:MAG: acetate/propionate family kinase [Rhodovarius sp.]|nr:acetate/propionate family kinase [Rhodovarius sp.]